MASLPVQIKEYIFGTNQARRIALEIQTTNYIVLELIKYSFDFNDPTYPLSYFLKKYDADDSERMLQSRIVQYAMKYKKRELLRNHIDIPSNHKFANIEMKSIDQKLNGYRFTEMNFFEHQNIHNIEIIKAIVENRIGSAKKISNQRFMEMFKQYDNMVEGLLERSAKSDRDCVFSSLALFTLEWQYSIETLYDLACLMEEKEICDINISDLGTVAKLFALLKPTNYVGVITIWTNPLKINCFNLLIRYFDRFFVFVLINFTVYDQTALCFAIGDIAHNCFNIK